MRLYIELAAVADVCRHLALDRSDFERLPAHLAEALLAIHDERNAALIDSEGLWAEG